MAVQSQNIRIRLKAFDYRVLDASTQEIVSTALSQATKKAAPGRSGLRLVAGARDIPRVGLLGDFGNHARANGTTAFADREAQTVFHRDGGDQLHVELQVVARHNHFSAFWQLNGTGDVCGPEVELWTVVQIGRAHV